MTDKHTPGPWVVKFRKDGSSYICMGGILPGQKHKQFDLLLNKESTNDEADANLMGASPDMLAALEAMRDNATIAAVCPSPLWAQMGNAIGKARGTV